MKCVICSTYRSPSINDWEALWKDLLKQWAPHLGRGIIWTTAIIAQVSSISAITLKPWPHIISLSKVNHNYALRVRGKLVNFTPQTTTRHSHSKLIHSWTRILRQVVNPVSCTRSFLSFGIVLPITRANQNLKKKKTACNMRVRQRDTSCYRFGG